MPLEMELPEAQVAPITQDLVGNKELEHQFCAKTSDLGHPIQFSQEPCDSLLTHIFQTGNLREGE